MSHALSICSGSPVRLNDPLRSGSSPTARQIRMIEDGLRQVAAAIALAFQCVAFWGLVEIVRRSTSMMMSSESRRGVPARGSSDKPTTRCTRKLSRHFLAVVTSTPRSAATSHVVRPRPYSKTMCARVESLRDTVRCRANRSRDARSVSLIVSGGKGCP